MNSEKLEDTNPKIQDFFLVLKTNPEYCSGGDDDKGFLQLCVDDKLVVLKTVTAQ